ncbi:hypothetical protein RhiirA5_415438 [Rhizophagus irregularis]|uniref:Uncharacterized protein n=1 Tax=Rhizophagus irregularis TaxID=588596 RepID=A0A2N0PS27_9GLOM|nr:hypothetical protein RhiirA5_415438 [Rhizophagus irregularis]
MPKLSVSVFLHVAVLLFLDNSDNNQLYINWYFSSNRNLILLKYLILVPLDNVNSYKDLYLSIILLLFVEISQFPLSSIYRVATSNGHSHGRTNK